MQNPDSSNIRPPPPAGYTYGTARAPAPVSVDPAVLRRGMSSTIVSTGHLGPRWQPCESITVILEAQERKRVKSAATAEAKKILSDARREERKQEIAAKKRAEKVVSCGQNRVIWIVPSARGVTALLLEELAGVVGFQWPAPASCQILKLLPNLKGGDSAETMGRKINDDFPLGKLNGSGWKQTTLGINGILQSDWWCAFPPSSDPFNLQLNLVDLIIVLNITATTW